MPSTKAILTAATGVVDANTPDELQRVLKEACARVMPFDFFSFALFDEKTESLAFLAGDDAGEPLPPEVVPLEGTPSEAVVRERRSLLVHTAADPRGRGARLVGSGRRSESAIRVPVLSGTRVMGVISVQSYSPHRYTAADVELLEVMASVAATALRKIELLNDKAEAEQRVRLLLESTAEAIYGLDNEGRCTFVNPACLRLLGYERASDLLGKSMHELTHYAYADGRAYSQEACKIYQAFRLGEKVHVDDEVFWRQDGTAIPVEYWSYPIREGEQVVGAVVTFLDISERLRGESERLRLVADLNERVKELSTLHEVAKVLQGHPFELEPLLQRIAERLPAGWQYPEITGARIAVGDKEARTANFAPTPWRQRADFALRDGTACCVEVCYLEARPPAFEGPFLKEEGELIRSIAAMLERRLEEQQSWLALQALNAQLERRVAHLFALHAIDRAISGSVDLAMTLEVVIEQVRQLLGVDAVAVLLYHRERQALAYAAGRGFRTPALRHSRLRLGEGLAGQAALERQLVYLPKLEADASLVQRARHLKDEGFVSYVAVPLIAKGQLEGVLEVFHRSPLEPDEGWRESLQSLAVQAAIAIENANLFARLERSNLDLRLAYDATIEGWARALDLKDHETEGHSRRVTELTVALAEKMGLAGEELADIRRGALLHDIGKMGVPDAILLKPGKLDDREWAVMRSHTTHALELLSPIPFLRKAIDIPYCHHEKWDGSGYPRGLKGEEIPLAARIFAVVDVYDALTSERPYRAAWPRENALAHICREAGKHFDPKVVEAFLELLAYDDGG